MQNVVVSVQQQQKTKQTNLQQKAIHFYILRNNLTKKNDARINSDIQKYIKSWIMLI